MKWVINMNKSNIERYTRDVLLFADIKNKDILVHLVDIVFSENKNRPMKRHVLRDRLSTILDRKIDKNIDRSIQGILDEGINSKKIVHNSKDDTYNMSESKYSEVNAYMENFLALEDNFKNEFLEFIKKESTAINVEYLGNVSEGIADIMKKYLYSNGIVVFQKIMNFEDTILNVDELKGIVLEVYRKYDFDMYTLVEIEELIKKYFLRIHDKEIEYIIEVLKKIVFLRLYNNLNLKNSKDFLRERIFYIDTNILIPLIFSNHPQSSDVRGIIRKCREQNIKLRIATTTIDEYRRLFNYLKLVDRNFREAGVYESRRFVKNLSKAKINSEIYSYYLDNSGTFKDFTSFVKTFCDDIYYYLELYNIEEEGINEEISGTICTSGKHEEFIGKLFSIKDDNREHISENSVEHDVFMMEYINNIRGKNDEIDELGHKIWFVTLDKKLEKFRFNNKKEFLYPITMTVDELYDLLLPFYIEKKEFTEDYVRHLINSNIGLYDYNEEERINLNVLNCVFNSGIDIKQLDGLNDKEQLKLIYMIQSNRNIKQTCEQIDKNDRTDIENVPKNVEIVEELKKNLKELVKHELEAVKEKDMEMCMEKLARKLSQAKEKNLELEEFKKKYYALVEQNKKETKSSYIKKHILKIVNTIFCNIRQLFRKIFYFESTHKE